MREQDSGTLTFIISLCSHSRVILLKARELTGTAATFEKQAGVGETETVAYLRMWVI